MWCFPKLKQSMTGCSLRTGMYLICWTSLIWNFVCFVYIDKEENRPQPEILKFLNKQNSTHSSHGHYHFRDYSMLYYEIQMLVMIVALLGIRLNSSFGIITLIWSETVILLMYGFMTLCLVFIPRIRSRFKYEIHPALLATLYLIISAFKYYEYLIILSFYGEVSNGQDGRRHGTGGIVIANEVASPFAPASVRYQNIQIIPSFSYIGSPYGMQPPHTSIITQPSTAMYPSNEIPQTVIQTGFTAPVPGLYTMPQTVSRNDKPPPYAP